MAYGTCFIFYNMYTTQIDHINNLYCWYIDSVAHTRRYTPDVAHIYAVQNTCLTQVFVAQRHLSTAVDVYPLYGEREKRIYILKTAWGERDDCKQCLPWLCAALENKV